MNAINLVDNLDSSRPAQLQELPVIDAEVVATAEALPAPGNEAPAGDALTAASEQTTISRTVQHRKWKIHPLANQLLYRCAGATEA